MLIRCCTVSLLFTALLTAQTGGRGVAIGGILGPVPFGSPNSPQNGPPPATDCAASGIVVNAITGAPIPRAMVQGNGSGGAASDAKGEWSMTNQRCGVWIPNATRPGFFSATPGLTAAGPRKLVDLVSGSPATGVKIELMPEASISGTVLNSDGDPLADARIMLMHSMILNGYRVLTGAQNGQTDQEGNFRIDHLQPGRYIACAGSTELAFPVGGGPALVYPEECYPGPPSQGPSAAMPIDPGKEARISLTLRAQPPLHVRGVVEGASGGRGSVNLMKTAVDRPMPGVPLGGMMMGLPSTNRGGQILPDGTFDITNVTPGNYIATARVPGPGRGMPPTATARITVGDSDVNGVQLTIQPPVPVNGTVRYELAGGTPAVPAAPANQGQFTEGALPVAGPGVIVNLSPAEPSLGGVGQPQWDDDHLAFNWPEVSPGSWILNANVRSIPGAYIKSATLRGQDVLNQPFPIDGPTGPIEIVVSDDSGIFQANVTDADGHPVPGFVVLKPAAGRPLTGRAGHDGVVSIENVPTGDYSVWAFDNMTDVPWNEDDWMARNAGSPIRVTISKTAGAAPVTLKRITAPAQ
ncbi:MAG TPA: carboxypeptidase-like regulatory domain-containing protein [Bryobacteraceae bacterium]|nr:carboxypeptidase-like regulatory domain-containing protein [Bryobacteraceae bacterium]